MNVLTVVSHPRRASLTFVMAERFVSGLRDAGHTTEVLDLHRSGFDPVLRPPDEPRWTAEVQHYSAAAEREMRRVEAHDALAFVFPLWWWSVPAELKGYIDRVWNYGFAYGPRHLRHQSVLWLALAGAPVERFRKHGYDGMIEHYFNVGLAQYVGIRHSKVEMLYGTVEPTPAAVEAWARQAYRAGATFGTDTVAAAPR